MQWLIRTGCLKVQGNPKALVHCESPKFSSCEFGKGHCRSNKVNTIKKDTIKEQDINNDYLCLDIWCLHITIYLGLQVGSTTQKGKSDRSDIFSGGCVFIYHASGYMSIKHQVAIKASETVKAKLTFEREDQSQVVVIKGYHTDNWIFNA